MTQRPDLSRKNFWENRISLPCCAEPDRPAWRTARIRHARREPPALAPCPQVHRRDVSIGPRACGLSGQSQKRFGGVDFHDSRSSQWLVVCWAADARGTPARYREIDAKRRLPSRGFFVEEFGVIFTYGRNGFSSTGFILTNRVIRRPATERQRSTPVALLR